ncbi:hypothetical protein D3C87_1090170 [compost metagenome]
MRGKIPKLGVLGVLAASMVGCGVPTPMQSLDVQPPASNAPAELPALTSPDVISPSEMVKGEDPELFETQQRVRRPVVRWRRQVHRGVVYWAPYNYFWWGARPFYRPFYTGPNVWLYRRPGFRHPRVRIRTLPGRI